MSLALYWISKTTNGTISSLYKVWLCDMHGCLEDNVQLLLVYENHNIPLS